MPIVLEPVLPSADVTGLAVVGGALTADSAAHRRIYHKARGYTYSDVAVTVAHRMDTTAPSADYEVGAIARRLDPGNWLMARVQGTVMYLLKSDGGVVSTLGSGAGFVAMAANTDYWVRLICDGNALRAEHWISEPTPMGAPAAVLSHTLAGADAAKFGTDVEGQAGIYWIPGASYANARITSFRAEPYTYLDVVAPKAIAIKSVPGTAPALVDVEVAATFGSEEKFALLALDRAPSQGVGPAATALVFDRLMAESATGLSGWSVGTRTGSLGAQVVLDTTPTSAETYEAYWDLDPSTIEPDPFSDEIAVELWARVLLSGSLVAPRLAGFSRSATGAPQTWTEHGSTGKLLTLPSGTADTWRRVRLGTLSLPARDPQTVQVGIKGTLGVGSAGTAWGIDYALSLPSRAVARSPSGKAGDTTYPTFLRDAAPAAVKRVRHDLSATVMLSGQVPLLHRRDSGLGGAELRAEPGDNRLLVAVSSIVPDDPTVQAASDPATRTLSLHAAVTPRYRLAAAGGE